MPFDPISYSRAIAKKKRSDIVDFFSLPFWTNIPDKPSTFPSALSQLSIDVDKDWGGKNISGLGALTPSTDNSGDLGSSSLRWRDGYFAGTLYANDLYPIDDYVAIKTRAHFLVASPWYGNNIAFKTPYKAERYDYGAETWTDITNAYPWKYLTDMKAYTYLDSGVRSPDGSETNWRIRLYYDLGGGYRRIHGVLIVCTAVPFVKEVVLEASSVSDFGSDVLVMKNWSGSVHLWDGAFFVPVDVDIGARRYVRLTITLATDHTQISMGLRNIALISLIPHGAFWDSLLPLDYDSDRNLTTYGHVKPATDNTNDLGSSSLRWANVYAVNIITGDLCFEEKVCEVCGKQFEEGEELVLKVKEVDNVTRTIPIHLKCSDAYRQLDERLRKLEVSANG